MFLDFFTIYNLDNLEVMKVLWLTKQKRALIVQIWLKFVLVIELGHVIVFNRIFTSDENLSCPMFLKRDISIVPLINFIVTVILMIFIFFYVPMTKLFSCQDIPCYQLICIVKCNEFVFNNFSS